MKDSKKPDTICPLMSGVSADGAPSRFCTAPHAAPTTLRNVFTQHRTQLRQRTETLSHNADRGCAARQMPPHSAFANAGSLCGGFLLLRNYEFSMNPYR